MKKRLALLILALFVSNSVYADFGFDTEADYTGEAFFAPADSSQNNTGSYEGSSGSKEDRHTVPPIKQLRLRLQEHMDRKEAQRYELAPTASDVYTGELETSKYASQEVEDNFDEMIAPDGFEADEDAVADIEKPKKSLFKRKAKKTTSEETEDIVLDCQHVNYDTDKSLVYATGDVSVEFVKQGIIVDADIITFDRINNTVKAEGNVNIVKGSQTVTGDYIFVDLNEENALIENPMTRMGSMKIQAKKGYVYGDRIVQENGVMDVDESFPINFRSGTRGPRLSTMLLPKDETLTEDMSKGLITFKAKDIVITQKGDLETISFTKPHLYKGDKTIFKTRSIKFYTNKNHDYGETDHWEIGAYRGLGLYAGPGWVFELPKGSVLKAIPMLNYKSGLGVGGLARFNSGTNRTMAAYGSAEDRFIVLGEQKLDDNLKFAYGMNAYMDEWFMGRRRPKYGTSLIYDKGYSSKDFLLKGKESSYRHRFDAGYYQDLDFDGSFERLQGTEMGTTRFRYMGQISQNFYKYQDKEKLKAFSFDLRSQLSSAIYGTGDTQVIGRLGPVFHMQYKRWMQDIGYYFSVYDDNTPMPVYDAFRYGKQNLYLREYFRLCRWLTVSWFGSINLSNDAINGRDLQENSFYFSFGPDDLKFNLGYDFVRETLRCTVEVMMDAKGTHVEYDKFEIKQDKKAEAKKKNEPAKKSNQHAAPTQPKVLQKAVVEDIKVHEDVL